MDDCKYYQWQIYEEESRGAGTPPRELVFIFIKNTFEKFYFNHKYDENSPVNTTIDRTNTYFTFHNDQCIKVFLSVSLCRGVYKGGCGGQIPPPIYIFKNCIK